MKLIEQQNRGSLSRWYYVKDSPHEVMEDWATGWYKVILKEEVESVTAPDGQTIRKFNTIGTSKWLTSEMELERYLEEHS